MANILAIARKELKAYFASPIAYVLVGLFALIWGFFYFTVLAWFVRQSMQMSGMQFGPTNVNINQMMVRPLLQQAGVIVLFLLPMVTMRTYAEEKRVGTIELLLTSPLTDLQIILGKFLGAIALYALMLAVTLPHVGLLFVYGNPEWRPIVTGYLGLLLLGGSFIAIGLFVSSTTRNQIVAGAVTFVVLLLFWILNWLGDSAGPTGQSILAYLSITEHLDDFTKGVIDTKHLVYYASFIAFGLFLTAKSVDTERWRG